MSGDPDAFMAHLYSLRHDVAALGRLRRYLPDHDTALALQHVEPYLRGVPDAEAPVWYLTGALYALWPAMGKHNSLGRAFRHIIEMAPRGTVSGGNASGHVMYERRFGNLLATTAETRDEPLRHAVILCAQHKVPLAWSRVLRDLITWDDDDGAVKRRLARECWG